MRPSPRAARPLSTAVGVHPHRFSFSLYRHAAIAQGDASAAPRPQPRLRLLLGASLLCGTAGLLLLTALGGGSSGAGGTEEPCITVVGVPAAGHAHPGAEHAQGPPRASAPAAGLDEGLLSLSLPILGYMENPYSYKK